MANVVVSAIATFNGKALKKGAKEVSTFDKQIKKLGKTFAAIGVGAFAKSAVNAFIESEKAAAKLRTTVKNLGLEFEQPGIEDYLKKLSLQFGIVDENLIPGFQRLLIVTKDVAKAQSLFETALNVSAGTGKDLTAVSTSLSKAYLGDNAALGRLGVGLSKAQLKSASFLEVQRTLNVNFAGQAAAAVEGYAGSMAKLTVAVDESKEAIGKGLLDALAALSNSNDIDTFTAKMVRAAEKIGNAFATIGDVLGLLNPNVSVKVGGNFMRKSDINAPRLSPAKSRADLIASMQVTKARKEEFSIITKKNALENKNLEELKKKFDLERIGINAALNSATDEETKLRLKAQLAILDNNEALAKKYLAELEAADALKKLAAEAAAAGKTLTEFALVQVRSLISRINAQIESINKQFGMPTTAAAPTVSAPGLPSQPASYFQELATQLVGSSSYAGMNVSQIATERARESGNRSLDVNLVINSPSGDRFAQLMAESIQVANRSGYGTTGAGQLP